MKIPLAQQIACVEREVRMRERVYPRRVAEFRMKQTDADRELEAMRAVLATLQEARRRQEPGLFDQGGNP